MVVLVVGAVAQLWWCHCKPQQHLASAASASENRICSIPVALRPRSAELLEVIQGTRTQKRPKCADLGLVCLCQLMAASVVTNLKTVVSKLFKYGFYILFDAIIPIWKRTAQ